MASNKKALREDDVSEYGGRFDKAIRLLALMQWLQNKTYGATNKEIKKYLDRYDGLDEASEKGINIRTVQRMMASLEESNSLTGLFSLKRDIQGKTFVWRITRSKLPETSFTSDELSFIQNLLKKNTSLIPRGEISINSLINKLRSLHPKMRTESYDMDFDPLVRTTGFAKLPGPQENINEEHFSLIIDAIRCGTFLKINYTSARNIMKEYEVFPMGLLYGERVYLVLSIGNADAKRAMVFRLSGISRVEVTDRYFDPDELGFDWKEFTKLSFGVFHPQKTWDVEWVFDKAVAKEIDNYQFMPTDNQVAKTLDDGRVRVTFKAGGLVEMCHELFKWGRRVEIVSPHELQEMYNEMRKHTFDRFEGKNHWEY